jgi:anthranilate phosphoribosyltransferase
MKGLLEKVLEQVDLTEAEAAAAMKGLTDEGISDVVKAGFLTALRTKGETAEELRGMAMSMRKAARRFEADIARPYVDTCGTGGDGSHSINISTAVALLVASIGHAVVKHGNRSVSSKSGSADVLEAMGIPLPADPKSARAMLETYGYTFLFAPVWHPSMKAVVPVRRALGVRTAFNLLGPLTNPASPEVQLLGAFSAEAAGMMAATLSGMPIERAYVVHGAPHWDEATPMGPFVRFDVRPGLVVEERVDPLERYGIPRCEPEDLAGGDAEYNARALLDIFAGKKGAGRDAVVLNAVLVLELLGHESDAALEIINAALDDGSTECFVEQLRGAK